MKITEENPLLENIIKIDSLREFARKLTHRPLEFIDIKSLSVMEKNELLMSPDTPYEPTSMSLRVGVNLLTMLRSSYQSRNPLIQSNRLRFHKLLACDSKEILKELSFGNPMGFVIKGVTGLGKTALLKRVLPLVPELIIHDRNKKAGWIRQYQIPIIVVELPTEGSRGGFIHAIFSEIDRITGTNKAESTLRKSRSIDRSEVDLKIALHNLFVGLLIVEEVQEKKIVSSSSSKALQQLLLSIMNVGIPVVLVGNPMGFTWLKSNAQDLRRFNHIPPANFRPLSVSISDDNSDWDIIFNSIYSYYVLNEHPVSSKKILSHVLRSLSGGIPALAMTLWRTAQMMILFGEVSQGGLSEGALKAAYSAKGFDDLRPMADGFTYQDSILLSQFDDMPLYISEDVSKMEAGKYTDNALLIDNARIQVGTTHNGPKKKPRSERAKLKSANTRKKNKKEKRNLLNQTLSEDDLRRRGITSHHLDHFSDLCDFKE